jgi:hypothetical protein
MRGLMLGFANLCSRQWAPEHGAQKAEVERPSAQREHAPQHGDDAERVVPVEEAHADKPQPAIRRKARPPGLLMNRENPDRLKLSAVLMALLRKNDIEEASIPRASQARVPTRARPKARGVWPTVRLKSRPK